MSERGLFSGEKCPQSCVEEILQNRQLYFIWPHFQPQIKLLCRISTLKWGFLSSFLNIHLKIKQNRNTNLQKWQMFVISEAKCLILCILLKHIVLCISFNTSVIMYQFHATFCYEKSSQMCINIGIFGRWPKTSTQLIRDRGTEIFSEKCQILAVWFG